MGIVKKITGHNSILCLVMGFTFVACDGLPNPLCLLHINIFSQSLS